MLAVYTRYMLSGLDRRGFGSALLEAAIQGDQSVSATLSYEPEGFVYELDAPLSAVQRSR